jgi:glycosyltransferase involved in cell wall biosynthesis
VTTDGLIRERGLPNSHSRYDLAVSDLAAARPRICLNMIVRNETHIIRETLDSVAPHISSWVIVDTGSDDGTQHLILDHMATLGIPGELYERAWRDFGHNRTEALTLAQGHADFILVMDADDKIVGAPDFTGLDADVCFMRLLDNGIVHWRAQLFRNGTPLRYVGVVHETPVWDDSCVLGYLKSDYHIESRRLGARNKDPRKYERDRDLLLAEVESQPENPRWVFYLAQTYYDLGDYANARKWYERRIELAGWDQEIYHAMFRLADSLKYLDAPWPDVQDAYLRAWEFRPSRAEALHALAFHYRAAKQYQLGYLFAERAAQIPPPEDQLFVTAGVYAWYALDEQAVCASWIGKQAEAFNLCRKILSRNDIPDHDRARIAVNRDALVPAMIDAMVSHAPVEETMLKSNGSEVVATVIAGPDRFETERTLNSFLNCCTDIERIGRILLLEDGIADQDRLTLQQRYRFLEFASPMCGTGLAQIRELIDERYWLHLGRGWQFFAPEKLITRLTAVLAAEPHVFQVGVNFADALKPSGAAPAEHDVHRAPEAGRYVLTDAVSSGPAMIDTVRLDLSGQLHSIRTEMAVSTPHTATLDEVLCTTTT